MNLYVYTCGDGVLLEDAGQQSEPGRDEAGLKDREEIESDIEVAHTGCGCGLDPRRTSAAQQTAAAWPWETWAPV